MGIAKHKRSRCNCGRVGTTHRTGCHALTPVPKIEMFTVPFEKGFADVIREYHALVAQAEPSISAFIAEMTKRGLDAFITEIKAVEQWSRLIVPAIPSEVGKALADLRKGGPHGLATK